MYLPQHFEETRPEVLHALVRAHPLALLIHTGTDGAQVANAIPLMLEAATGEAPAGVLVGHVARANPLWEQAAGKPVLVVFQGADGYVSPGWYPSKAEHGKVVPTWNYVMVQGRGELRVLQERDAKHALVSRLTRRHEEGRDRPWAPDDAPADYLETMLRSIAVIEIPLQSLVGKYKLSQNRGKADRDSVLRGLQADHQRQPDSSVGDHAHALLKAMTDHGGPA
jgi:transcriptional regulator